MDGGNLNAIYRVCGGNYAERICLLPNFTDHPGDVSAPWRAEDFNALWRGAKAGCRRLPGALTES